MSLTNDAVTQQADDAVTQEIVVACDGRLSARPLFSAVVEGVRWSGRGVAELHRVSPAQAIATAVGEGACGIVYLGNPLGKRHTAGLRFWEAGGRPWNATLDLAIAEASTTAGPCKNRPARRFGSCRRLAVPDDGPPRAAGSLDTTRPMRIVLACDNPPACVLLKRLFAPLPCHVVWVAGQADAVVASVRETRAHVGVAISDDAQRIAVVDERGRVVTTDRVACLLDAVLLRDDGSADSREANEARHVTPSVETNDWSMTASRNSALSAHSAHCTHAALSTHSAHSALSAHSNDSALSMPRRRAFDVLAASGAEVGLESCGRVWFQRDGRPPIADGAAAVAMLLQKLSVDDRPLSQKTAIGDTVMGMG